MANLRRGCARFRVEKRSDTKISSDPLNAEVKDAVGKVQKKGACKAKPALQKTQSNETTEMMKKSKGLPEQKYPAHNLRRRGVHPGRSVPTVFAMVSRAVVVTAFTLPAARRARWFFSGRLLFRNGRVLICIA